jgi:hypothetical protein
MDARIKRANLSASWHKTLSACHWIKTCLLTTYKMKLNSPKCKMQMSPTKEIAPWHDYSSCLENTILLRLGNITSSRHYDAALKNLLFSSCMKTSNPLISCLGGSCSLRDAVVVLHSHHRAGDVVANSTLNVYKLKLLTHLTFPQKNSTIAPEHTP